MLEGSFDFAVVGGGIVGLSVACALQKRDPRSRVLVLEKEGSLAAHQTHRNSGVIHSGIYYRPGSLKARFSRRGGEAMAAFCREHEIPVDICGKLIVATRPGELARLEGLLDNGLRIGLAVEKLGPGRLKELEPHAGGLAAVRVPETGIVDYRAVALALARQVRENDGRLQPGAGVEGVREYARGVGVSTGTGEFEARVLVNCAGLQSDRVAALCGLETGVRTVPFRGEYYKLVPERRHLVEALIYPVPDPGFPFLGVHFTRTVYGEVEAGPNAVLGLAREGYRKTEVDFRDLGEVLSYPGFWRLARNNWRTGAAEMARSLSKRAFVKSLQRLVPEVREEDLEPAPAGIRAQALKKDGRLADDFFVVRGRRSVHVLNAPSPAATAALPIGEEIARRAAELL